MSGRGARRGLAGLALLLILCLGALPLWAGPLNLAGRVLGPDGAVVAGAILSDGVDLTATDAQGNFRLASEEGRVLTLTAPAGWVVQGRWWWPTDQAEALRAQLRPVPTGGPARVALLSDPHLMSAQAPTQDFPAPPGGLDLPMKVWERVAGQLRQTAPDLCIVTGDLCMDGEKGGPEHLEAQLALAGRALAMLPQPARALPGNHDARYVGEGAVQSVDLGPWRSQLGPARQVYLLGGAAWLLLDNLGAGQDGQGKHHRALGQTSPQTLAWLERALKLLPAETPLVLLSHYPLISPLSGANPLRDHDLVKTGDKDGLALRNVDQAAGRLVAMLKDRRVLALVNGHEHAHQQSILHLRGGDRLFLGLPAVCGRWWLGDRGWGELSFPPGYLVLTLSPGADGPEFSCRFVEVRF